MGGLLVFAFVIGCMAFMFFAPGVSRRLARRRKVTRRYSDEFAVYVAKHLTQREVPFTVRWVRVPLFSPRPPRSYILTMACITYPWVFSASADLAQADAAEESRRDDERKRDEEIARRYADRPTIDLHPNSEVLTF